MSFEEIPNWIYTLLIAPIALAFQKYHSLNNKVTELETTQTIYVEKIDKVCEKIDDLSEKIHIMTGRLDEHLKR